MLIFAAIYVPDFPVAAILRAEPELREQAVAVLEGAPPLGRVIALNERAAEATADVGMTKLHAEERLRAACGERGWEVRQRSAASEATAHAALLDVACAFSPRVEDTAADTVVLDLAGLERIFGPPARIAREVARRCSEIGMEANVAVAGNPDAAIHAARGFEGVTVIAPGKEAERLGALPVEVLCSTAACGTAAPGCDPQPPKSRAKRARDSRQDAGATAGELREKFERWGVRTLRALATLPEVAVVERLGQQGLHLQRLARGAVERPLVPAEPPLVFEESAELEYPIELLEPLAFVLSNLLEQLCARLAMRSLATNELKLRMELGTGDDESGQSPGVSGQPERTQTSNEKCIDPSSGSRPPQDDTVEDGSGHRPLTTGHSGTFERILRLPVPMCDAKVFLKLWQLELRANPPSAPVEKVWLRAEPVQPRVAQQGLFAPAAPQAERLEVTLKRIERVVGSANGEERRVGSAEVLDDHKPDAFRVNRFVVQSTVDGRRPTAKNIDPSSGLRSPQDDTAYHCPPTTDHFNRQSEIGNRQCVSALRVFRPPLRVAVTMKEERPVALTCPERSALRGEVTWCAGPWRASGEWWESSQLSGPWAVGSGQPGKAEGRVFTNVKGNGASGKEEADGRPHLSSVPAPIADTRGLMWIANRQSALGNRQFAGWAREEWDIAVDNEEGTTLYRLYYDVAQRAWFLFGSYD